MLKTVIFMSFKNDKKNLFLIGGIGYALIEILWRGKTHWSMVVTGGLCFIILFKIFEKIDEFSLKVKCFVGGAVITSVEFLSGCILNRFLKLNVWDYSKNHFNLKGQICAFYSVMWMMLSFPVSLICKKMRKI